MVAERAEEKWATATWGREMRTLVDRLAQGLLDCGRGDQPVMVLSGNGRLHLAVALAVMTVGAAVVPASVAYSRQATIRRSCE